MYIDIQIPTQSVKFQESLDSWSEDFHDLTEESKEIMEEHRMMSLNEEYLKQHLNTE